MRAKRPRLSSEPYEDEKPDLKPDLLDEEKPNTKTRTKPKSAGGAKLPPGAKAAFATLIVQRGLANLPPHTEIAALVSYGSRI